MNKNAIKALQLINRYGLDNSEWYVQEFDSADDFTEYNLAKYLNFGRVEFPATLLVVYVQREDFDGFLQCEPDGCCMVEDQDVLMWQL